MRGKEAGAPGTPGIPDPTPTYPGASTAATGPSQGRDNQTEKNHIYELDEPIVS